MSNSRWNQSENLDALSLFAELKKYCVKLSAKDKREVPFAVAIGWKVSGLMMRIWNSEYFYSNGLHGLRNGGKNLWLFYVDTFPILK